MARIGQKQHTLWDYSSYIGLLTFNSIVRPIVTATDMEMKSTLMHLVQNNQFHGLSHENP